MRDFLPADKARREHALGVLRSVYRRFGFDEIETPVLENFDRLHSGLGGDNEKLAYNILRGIGPATETQLFSFAENNAISFREAMRNAEGLGLGPKVTGAITALSDLLDEAAALADTGKVADVLTLLVTKSALLETLRNSRDPQDEARAENIEELMAVTKEFEKNNPDGTLIDFLTEVSLVAAASYADRILFLADGRIVDDRPRTSAEEISRLMLAMETAR